MNNTVRFQCHIETHIKEEIESYKTKDKQLSSVITEMLDAYKTKCFLENVFSEDIKKVCEIKDFTFQQLTIEAFRDYIKKVKNANKKGLTSHSKSVKADKRISEVIEAIIEHNNKAKSAEDVIYINHSSILSWLRKNNLTLINPNVINRYLRVHNDYLKNHHEELNIGPSHNREVFRSKKFKK